MTAQFLSLGFLCGWGSIWGFGAFMVPREWKPCLGNVLCCAEGFGKARGVGGMGVWSVFWG